MELSERLNLNDYFNDSRFQLKKPKLNGDWKERCGDNFYSQKEDGTWQQHRNRFHNGISYLKKDTRRPNMFVGERFWYLGKSSVIPPREFLSIIGGRSIQVNHPEKVVSNFIDWVKNNFKEGIIDVPNDNPDI